MKWFATIALGLGVCALDVPGETLLLRGTVPLTGVKGRFDHFAVDPKGLRLFVAALGNNTLEVIDIAGQKKIANIPELRKPTGAVFLPERNEIAVASGSDGILKVFSGTNYKQVATVGSLHDADNVRLDAARQSVFVGYGEGALAKIDTGSWKKVADFRLPAHPESFQLERTGNHIFANVPGTKQVVVLDREKGPVASFAMEKFQANFPMALDESNHRLFVGCRRPARLVVLSTEDGKVMGDTEISDDTDDLFYDAKRGRVYISCGQGFIDVISGGANKGFKRIEKIPTRSGARTSFFAADLDRFFLAVPGQGRESAELRIYEPKD